MKSLCSWKVVAVCVLVADVLLAAPVMSSTVRAGVLALGCAVLLRALATGRPRAA